MFGREERRRIFCEKEAAFAGPGRTAVLEIDYDETRLTLTSAAIGEVFSTGAFVNINLPYVTFVRSGDVADDAVLLTLSFEIKSNAAMGDAYVTGKRAEVKKSVSMETLFLWNVTPCLHAWGCKLWR